VKNTLLIALLGAAITGAQTAQPAKPETPLAFEVASIKPAAALDVERLRAGQQHISVNVDAARVDFSDVSIAELIRSAYRVKLYQISGPEWITTTRFDVVAKLPEGAKADQVPEMLKSLLAERFHLALHNDTKEMMVYALVFGKDGKEGLKMKASTPGDPDSAPKAPAGPMSTSGPNGSANMIPQGNGLRVELTNMTVANILDWMARFTDRPVVDQTGLTGRYDLTLDVSREEMINAARGAGVILESSRRASDSATEPVGDSVFSSVKKVGLKLEARKLPLTLLVIDQMDKTPTEN
jgi:uncharacterized protein (TIGR03435 family)